MICLQALLKKSGTVRRIEHGAKGARLTIQANTVLEDTRIGDSIATNGVCLTVVSMTGDSFSADVMAESLRRSSLGTLQGGSPVNLERAMAANGRFGGHIVSGHIDGTARLPREARGQRGLGQDQDPRSPAALHRRKRLDRH